MYLRRVAPIILAVLFTVCSAAIGAEKGKEGPMESLEDLSWLYGRWVGEGFGGVCEEVWNPALGGTMTGSFKLVVDDKALFYEIMVISIIDGEPRLRLKHFSADLIAWEEKEKVIEFTYNSHSERSLSLDGITYSSPADGQLEISVLTKNGEGEVEEEVIRCVKTEN